MAGIFSLMKERTKEQRIVQIPIAEIFPNPHQPRVHFSADELRALSDSIRQNGIL